MSDPASQRPTRVLVDLDALTHNLAVIRAHVRVPVMGIVRPMPTATAWCRWRGIWRHNSRKAGQDRPYGTTRCHFSVKANKKNLNARCADEEAIEVSACALKKLLLAIIIYCASLATVTNAYAQTFNYIGQQSKISGTEKSLGLVSIVFSFNAGIIVSADEVHKVAECDKSVEWVSGCFVSDFISFGLPKDKPQTGERWKVGKFSLRNDGAVPFVLNGRKIDACLISAISQELGIFRTIYYVKDHGIVAFVAHASTGDEAYLSAP